MPTDRQLLPAVALGERRWIRCMAVLLLTTSLACFCNNVTRSGRLFDFRVIWVASGVWLNGGNPYDQAAVQQHWSDVGGPTQSGSLTHLWSIVSPPTFVLVSPLAAFPPIAAQWLWTAFLLGCTFAIVRCALIMAGVRAFSLDGCLLIAFALALTPLHLAVFHGQPTVPAVAFGLWGWLEARRNRPGMAGFLLGLAFCWKPHVAVAFLLHAAWRRQWRTLGIAAALTAVLTAVSVAWMYSGGHSDWLSLWQSNLRAASSNGLPNDYAFANSLRWDMVCLHVPLYGFLQDRAIVDMVAPLVAGILLLPLFRSLRRDNPQPLLELAILSTWCLLPVYHRWPDASVVVVAVVWVASCRPREDIEAWLPVASCLGLFLLPNGFIHDHARGCLRWICSPEQATRLWRVWIEPLQTWYVLLLLAALGNALRVITRRTRDAACCATLTTMVKS